MSYQIAEPRIETGKAMKLAGLSERYNCESSAAIPSLWQRLGAHDMETYSKMVNVPMVKYDGDENGYFNYMCAWEVAAENTPESTELQYLEIPAQTYLVFTHSNSVSTIRQTCITIWDKYLPQSKYKVSKGPEFELYDEKFDPITGLGGSEIWIPILN